mmetsp:Transcript_225/g.654  ORF Transcript_225/g.654 Transcript_225/m.654 type:complete len:284 (+) Transcript_225:115-966(+)
MHYMSKEFADLNTRKPAVWLSTTFSVVVVAYLLCQQVSLERFLTLKEHKPWVWELTILGFMLKVAQDVREQVAGYYWPKALVTTAIAAFGGGFLAPLIVGHCPTPFKEETYFWLLVFAWYITHHVPVVSVTWCEIARCKPGLTLLTILFGIFKTHQIVGYVEVAAKAVEHEDLIPHSRYFTVPCAGPLLGGFLGGCGGYFLPFDKGLRPLSEGKQWCIRATFFSTVLYYVATRWLHIHHLDAKMGVCILRILGDLFPDQRAVVMDVVTGTLYSGTNLRSEPEV